MRSISITAIISVVFTLLYYFFIPFSNAWIFPVFSWVVFTLLLVSHQFFLPKDENAVLAKLGLFTVKFLLHATLFGILIHFAPKTLQITAVILLFIQYLLLTIIFGKHLNKN